MNRQLKAAATARANEVWNALRTHGRSNKPAWGDPIVDPVIESVGGWCNLCMRNETERPWFLMEFIKAYQERARGDPVNTGSAADM
ncbi:MAG: DUF6475 domain-containing protein [Planctomycetota bacterium]